MSKITVTDVREGPSGIPGRLGKTDVIVTYTVDDVRAYQTRLNKEDSSPEAIRKQITAEEKDRLQVIGMEIEVTPPTPRPK